VKGTGCVFARVEGSKKLTDVPASTSTTASISVGGTIQGTLEVAGDHDWYRISLTAGQQVTISLSGTPGVGGVSDTYLNLRSSTGAIITYNDDSGGTLNSRIVFTAPATGTYYIDAGAWDTTSNPPARTNTITGNYTLSVQPYTPPPVWTYDQIADQLVNGYWNSEGQSARHFAVSQGGSITVNYSTLTPAEQALAIAALGEWSDIIGVTFTPVTTGGQIRFSDAEDLTAHGPVASTVDHTSGGLITSADIQISQSWVTGSQGYGTSLNSYSFQTYLHEIGHALGLGHAGDYNNTADYVQDALYANDSWSTTIMSYFDQHDNAYFANQGFTQEFVLTPMIADVVAMQQIYGLSTTTRTGNSTYGFNSNLGNSVYNATYIQGVTPSGTSFPGYTIIDSGGIDTLDYSGFSQAQVINLNPETFSNIGGDIGNVSIGRGTIIENAIGGSGSDTIIGNSAANVLTGNGGADTLTGGAGNDTFQDTLAGLNGDTITDFGAGDKIVITNASLSGFTFNVSGTTLTINGTTVVHLGAAPSGTITASAASGGGVQLAIGGNPIVHDATNDFNGDHRSDILWRDDSGMLTTWLATSTGSFTTNSSATSTVALDWHVAGIADFNGDGRDDILWRQDGGQVTDWLGTAGGGFTPSSNFSTFVSTNWTIVGTGDFNGDGKSDILWRDGTGLLTDWLGSGTGTFSVNNSSTTSVGTNWQVVATGDFNGDGRDDILWRESGGQLTDWLGTSTGGFTQNSGAFSQFVATSWTVAATGDFNGDGIDDVLWRDDSTGQLTDWLGTSSGGFTANNANMSQLVSTTWHVASTGDFNGDGRDDILWRNDSGQMTEWLGTATGGFVDNSASASTFVGTNWHIEHAPNALL
jgi:hypothetical protein